MPNELDLHNFYIVTADSAVANPPVAARDRAVRSSDLELSGVDAEFLVAAGFKGDLAQTLLLPRHELASPAPTSPAAVIAVGLGDEKLQEASLRKAAAEVFRCAKRTESLVSSLAVEAADDVGSAKAISAVAEGMMLASYRFDEFKGDNNEVGESAKANSDPAILNRIFIVAPTDLDIGEAEAALVRATVVANGVALARDLVNRPAGSLTPSQLAGAAVQAAVQAEPTDAATSSEAANETRGEVTVEVWDRARLEKERCGGLLGVNAGSTEEPRLVQMKYSPLTQADKNSEESVPTIYLVGKGITFDTGGLNLKSFEGMQSMKTDMGGAAAVIGAMFAISRLAPNVRVVGICCCTDNQPGPNATKPGDVLRIRNGTTVEVLNTDAEGRLVLADGLSIAAETSPELIVDVATLTGACVVALGDAYAGVMSNSDSAAERLMASASCVGESMWRLPLPKVYRKGLDSDVADLRNIGKGRYAGALTAGLFLEEFVGSNDWIHIDIAGPVTTDTATGEYAKGASGFGVRTLVDLVLRYGH